MAVYQNGKLLVGTSIDENGLFSFDLSILATHIEVSFLGYEKSKLGINDINKKELFVFTLMPSSTNLNEVVIQNKKQFSNKN